MVDVLVSSGGDADVAVCDRRRRHAPGDAGAEVGDELGCGAAGLGADRGDLVDDARRARGD